MTGECGAGTGVGGRALPLPVTVRQILRDAFVLLSVGGGCWTKHRQYADRAGGCLLLWRQHRLGEAFDAADEFGA